ncbi:MAG: adenosylmethionine--8-amino-7-oxononanoate transaminase [Planctomycetota bacterium]
MFASTQNLNHWRGFTPMADDEPIEIASASGCQLTTSDGRVLFDGVSNLWCNLHGHGHPDIDAAVRKQLDQVAHITTLGMSCETTNRLADELAEITPGDLRHTFFCSDGSAAVEAALKMAFQYWQQCDTPKPEKTKFLAMSGAYHGDTTGSVALGGIKYFHRLFGPILFEPVRGPLPCTFRLPAGVELNQAADHYAAKVEALLEQHHHSIAAVVMEPLVQGAAGMITHPDGFLAQVRALCDQYDVLLICDEVAVGFGRTGEMFACEHELVTPDILCLGKGLSGGYLPLAAAIARPKIFDAFLGPASESRQFFHGHTFGGNPLACAAALASLDLCRQTTWLDRVNALATRLGDGLVSGLYQHPHVADIRGRGLMVGIELMRCREAMEAFAPELRIGYRTTREAIDRGVWLRPLGDVVVVMPPPCSSDEEVENLVDVICQSVQAATRDAP